MILLELADDEPEPHPDLVASVRPTPQQVAEAILHTGLFPPVPKFYPVEITAPGS